LKNNLRFGLRNCLHSIKSITSWRTPNSSKSISNAKEQ